jgi:phenylacetate-coenzyme A ligase PaaK-like adenylate-forming protein
MIGFTLRTLALRRAPCLRPVQVQAIQQRRLERLVRWAVERSPFYRAKYRGIDLSEIELTSLPPTHKSELMAHFDDVVTDTEIKRAQLERFIDDSHNEGRLYLGRYAASHTSGSQGQPMLIVQELRLLELMFGLQMTRGNAQKVSIAEAVKRFANPARLAVVTLKRGFYPSASSFEYMPSEARLYLQVLRLSHTDRDVVEKLNAFRPTALTGYAGVLESLALECEAGRLHLGPELIQIVNNSEVLTDRARQRIESAFGLRVMNNYATGECPLLSNGCRSDEGAHVNADWAILEVVDQDNRPVPAGTPGKKVLITNLANRIQPFIRYEVGDVVTMAADRCRCGSLLPRVQRIEGRTADTFWIQDGTGMRQMINSIFKNAFDYTREVREWQAIQVERNRIHVRLELLPGATLDEAHAWRALNRQLRMYGFHGLVDVSLEVVPKLEADRASGKFRRIVSLIGPPEGHAADTRVEPIRIDEPEPMRPMGISPHAPTARNLPKRP